MSQASLCKNKKMNDGLMMNGITEPHLPSTPHILPVPSPPALNLSSVNEELHLKAMVAKPPRSLSLPPSPSLCSPHLCTGLVPQSDAMEETKAMMETEGKASSSVKGT